MTVEIDLDALERAAKAAHKDVIRSHGWAGTVTECLLLDEDTVYLLAANPVVVLELVRRLREAEKDAARLNWLDAINLGTNERNETIYGWKFDINHHRAALTDHNIPALPVRAALDAAMGEPK